jgi:S-adenosylmethionine synthetase
MPTTQYAAEFCLPGHPDKLCDAVADALVEEAARRERRALCGVEVAVHRATVFVTGRIACRDAATIDAARIARDVFASAGYGGSWRPDPSELRVETDLCLGPLEEGEGEFRASSDDQSIVTGYAVDLPGTNYLPPEHWLAFRLARAVERLRADAPALCLGPDGKVFVAYEEDGPTARLAGLSVSLQQGDPACQVGLHRAVLGAVRAVLAETTGAIPGFDPTVPEALTVNGAGAFAVGGPFGDNGLSGKKLVADAYGPRIPIGGGALSGKDFYKADRAGAVIARRLAKAVVLTGAARACTATLACVPGAVEARIVSVRREDGAELDPARWSVLLDRTLAGAGDRFAGGRALVDVARYGHFTEGGRPWERLGFDGGGREYRETDVDA